MASEDPLEEQSLLREEGHDAYSGEPGTSQAGFRRRNVASTPMQRLEITPRSDRIFSDVSSWARNSRVEYYLRGCTCLVFMVLLIVVCSLLGTSIGLLRRIEQHTQYIPQGDLDSGASVADTSIEAEPPADQLTLLLVPENDGLLLMQVVVNDLGKEFEPPTYLFSAIFDYGSFFDGDTQASALLHMPAENTDDNLFQFQLSPDLAMVDLVKVPTGVRSAAQNSDSTVEQSTWPGYVTSLPVVQGPFLDRDYLVAVVDATELAMNGFYITDVTPELLQAYEIESSRVSSYPLNANCVVGYVFKETDWYPRYSVSLFFSITRLPKQTELLPPRLWDKRVGYFTSGYYEIGDARSEREEGHSSDYVDRAVKIIQKRNLPAKYYIDPSVPKQWRNALCEGVEAWNAAFWKIESVNATLNDEKPVQCFQEGDAGWPTYYDPGDSRYSTISWAVDLTETYSIGPATVDPRNGTIINSNIVFTNGWLKNWLTHLEEETNVHGRRRAQEASGEWPGKDDAIQRTKMILDKASFSSAAHAPDPRGTPFFEKLQATSSKRRGLHRLHGGCADAMMEHRVGVLDHFHESMDHRHLQNDDDPFDAILEAGLRDVVMHEVGHTLGLRHNFKGSTQRTKEQLLDKEYATKHGLTSSVMDYLPLNLWSKDFGGKFPPEQPLFSAVIGEYDEWAIRFGYDDDMNYESVFDEPFHPFSTDEDEPRPPGVDVDTNVFDLSDDPVAYYEDQLDFARLLKAEAVDRGVLAGEYQTRIESTLAKVQSTLLGSCVYMAKAIGGYSIAKTRKGEDDASPLRAVPQSVQTQALTNILEVLRGSDESDQTAFPIDAKELAVAVNREDCPNVIEGYCYGVMPVDPFALVDDRNRAILDALLARGRLERIRAQNRSDGIISVKEYLSKIAKALISGKAEDFTEVGDYTSGLLIGLANRTDPLVSSTVANAAYSVLLSVQCDPVDRNLVCHRIESWLKA